MTQSTTIEPVFDRLLQVVVEVFTECSFRETTAREICSRANINVISVNYYFRSKEALYALPLKKQIDCIHKMRLSIQTCLQSNALHCLSKILYIICWMTVI